MSLLLAASNNLHEWIKQILVFPIPGLWVLNRRTNTHYTHTHKHMNLATYILSLFVCCQFNFFLVRQIAISLQIHTEIEWRQPRSFPFIIISEDKICEKKGKKSRNCGKFIFTFPSTIFRRNWLHIPLVRRTFGLTIWLSIYVVLAMAMQLRFDRNASFECKIFDGKLTMNGRHIGFAIGRRNWRKERLDYAHWNSFVTAKRNTNEKSIEKHLLVSLHSTALHYPPIDFNAKIVPHKSKMRKTIRDIWLLFSVLIIIL